MVKLNVQPDNFDGSHQICESGSFSHHVFIINNVYHECVLRILKYNYDNKVVLRGIPMFFIN